MRRTCFEYLSVKENAGSQVHFCRVTQMLICEESEGSGGLALECTLLAAHLHEPDTAGVSGQWDWAPTRVCPGTDVRSMLVLVCRESESGSGWVCWLWGPSVRAMQGVALGLHHV